MISVQLPRALTIVNRREVLELRQLFLCEGEVLLDVRCKVLVSHRNWDVEQGTRSIHHDLLGPFTLLKLSEYQNATASDFVKDAVTAYQAVFTKLITQGAHWIQLDEPALVKDLTAEDRQLFNDLYRPLLAAKGKLKVLLQTYFGDVRDVYDDLISLPFDGLGLDFVEGKQTQQLVSHGFPDDKILFAGVVNGKNVWRNHYDRSLAQLKAVGAKQDRPGNDS